MKQYKTFAIGCIPFCLFQLQFLGLFSGKFTFMKYTLPKEKIIEVLEIAEDLPPLNDHEIVARALGNTLPASRGQLIEKKIRNSLSIVISYCKSGVDWIPEYIGEVSYNVTDITIISKCGKDVEDDGLSELKYFGAPINIIKLRNVGRCDHSFVYWIQHNRDKFDKGEKGDHLVLFLKDNPRQMANYRTFENVFMTASNTGFSCILDQKASSIYTRTPHEIKPDFRPLALHKKEKLDAYFEIAWSRTPADGIIDFKSDYENISDWRQAMEIVYPNTDLVPVCFGGMFMSQKKGLLKQPQRVWDNLEENLSRANNLEEGHFMERTWAGLAMPAENDKYLENITTFILPKIRFAEEGGALAGMTWVSESFLIDYTNAENPRR